IINTLAFLLTIFSFHYLLGSKYSYLRASFIVPNRRRRLELEDYCYIVTSRDWYLHILSWSHEWEFIYYSPHLPHRLDDLRAQLWTVKAVYVYNIILTFPFLRKFQVGLS